MRWFIAVALAWLVSPAVLPAGATDEPDELMPGRTVIIRDGTLAKFISKPPTGTTFDLPGSANDPTLEGGTLEIFDDDPFRPVSDDYVLPAGGWKALGSPPGSKGFRYKGAGSPSDPCRVVLVKANIVKAVCKGTGVTLLTPFTGQVGIVLTVGTDSKRYCASFGGTNVRNDGSLLRRKSAPPPGTCPLDLNSSTTSVTTTTTSTTPGGGQPPVNWGASMIAWWDLDQVGDTNRNVSGGTCTDSPTTGCQLQESAGDTITANTTEFRQPATSGASASFVRADDEMLFCPISACEELNASGEMPLTWGCWGRGDNADTRDSYMIDRENYVLAWTGGSTMYCLINDVDAVEYADGVAGNMPLDTWTHGVCVQSSATNTLTLFVNGQLSGTPNTGADEFDAATANSDFRLSSPGTGASSAEWDGQIDECFVDNVAWTATQACRVGRCQIDGTLCMCAAGTPANYRACSTNTDCRVGGNTTAICDISAGTCRGRDPGGVDCMPTACNAAAP